MRTPLLLLALLQLSLPGAAAWADARLGEGRADPAHIESHSTSACARIHPSDCAFHRFLTVPLAGAQPMVLRIRAGHGVRWVARAFRAAQAQSDVSLQDSRAPPTLS